MCIKEKKRKKLEVERESSRQESEIVFQLNCEEDNLEKSSVVNCVHSFVRLVLCTRLKRKNMKLNNLSCELIVLMVIVAAAWISAEEVKDSVAANATSTSTTTVEPGECVHVNNVLYELLRRPCLMAKMETDNHFMVAGRGLVLSQRIQIAVVLLREIESLQLHRARWHH